MRITMLYGAQTRPRHYHWHTLQHGAIPQWHACDKNIIHIIDYFPQLIQKKLLHDDKPALA